MSKKIITAKEIFEKYKTIEKIEKLEELNKIHDKLEKDLEIAKKISEESKIDFDKIIEEIKEIRKNFDLKCQK